MIVCLALDTRFRFKALIQVIQYFTHAQVLTPCESGNDVHSLSTWQTVVDAWELMLQIRPVVQLIYILCLMVIGVLEIGKRERACEGKLPVKMGVSS